MITRVESAIGQGDMTIEIVGWSKCQSYKDRRPPWIRFHRTMLDDHKYQRMSADARALLPMLWLLASEHDDPKCGRIEMGFDAIVFRLRMDMEKFQAALAEIAAAGFVQLTDNNACIESVTNPYPVRNETVTPEAETETETEYRTSEEVLVASKPATPPCPHQEIIAAYHEALPTCPGISAWPAHRQKLLRARWAENPKRQSLDYWKRFFAWVAESEFLTGQCEPAKDREPFVADLEWLIKPANFLKVIEGKYHRDNK